MSCEGAVTIKISFVLFS